jgi:hypothetical protein
LAFSIFKKNSNSLIVVNLIIIIEPCMFNLI